MLYGVYLLYLIMLYGVHLLYLIMLYGVHPFVLILFILGWFLSILMFLSPISFATFTKKLLNISIIYNLIMFTYNNAVVWFHTFI
jgi:hypothetical protein